MKYNRGNFFIVVIRTHRYNRIKLYKIIVNTIFSIFNNEDFQLQEFFKDKTTIMDKIFETNPTFHVKKHNKGKVQFLFCRSFLLVLANFLFYGKD